MGVEPVHLLIRYEGFAAMISDNSHAKYYKETPGRATSVISDPEHNLSPVTSTSYAMSCLDMYIQVRS